jgi:hypothetical protein
MYVLFKHFTCLQNCTLDISEYNLSFLECTGYLQYLVCSEDQTYFQQMLEELQMHKKRAQLNNEQITTLTVDRKGVKPLTLKTQNSVIPELRYI